MEWNDVYDAQRNRTGRIHRRGTPWRDGESGLVVCVWVCDGEGKLLLTRRAPEKSFAGTWENSGGAAKAGEDSRQAIVRELFEETGSRAPEEDFVLLRSEREGCYFFDHYCLRYPVKLEELTLLPGETDDAQWADFDQIHEMILREEICAIIGKQFLLEEPRLRQLNC